MLDKMWDDVSGGPAPEAGLGRLRKINTFKTPAGEEGMLRRSMSMPSGSRTPSTPGTPASPSSAKKDNVWRSVFNPGSNSATKAIGAQVFDKPRPNSPTVYDWLYSGESRSNYR